MRGFEKEKRTQKQDQEESSVANYLKELIDAKLINSQIKRKLVTKERLTQALNVMHVEFYDAAPKSNLIKLFATHYPAWKKDHISEQ